MIRPQLTFALALLLASFAWAQSPINDVFVDFNNVYKWDNSNGDTWDPFWADDDHLYSFADDGRGFGTQARNLAFHKLEGPSVPELVGSLVNSMDEYGKANKTEKDRATWKACGGECIDGVFYGFVSRHVYGKDSKDPQLRQTTFNASLIKSTDRGRTWTRSAKENYARPMWPGRKFSTPYFIHYGKNGGQVTQDQADKYVYAISTDGFWNNGDAYHLGRVLRSKLPDLNASDWTFYAGGDGAIDTSWTSDLEKAEPILKAPSQCGMTGATYVPALKRYVMIVWSNTRLPKWYEPDEQIYSFYQAEHPWGPWSLVSSTSDRHIVGGNMYGPALCAKFQESIGSDVKLWMFTSGCPFEDKPSGLYKAWAMPVVLRTGPIAKVTVIDDASESITYRGNWSAAKAHKLGYEQRTIHFTTTEGDSAELSFEGTGIELLSEKHPDLGKVDVYIDDQLVQTVDLAHQNFPRLIRVCVFSKRDLSPGRHTIKLVSKGGGYVTVDAFRVIESSR